MLINISELPRELQDCTSEIAERLGFTVDGNGYCLTAKQGDELKITFDGKTFDVTYPARNRYFRALKLIKQHFAENDFPICEKCSLEELGIMLDCSRNAVRSVEHIKEIIRNLALMGYNQLQLYTEDTYEIEGEPYFGYMTGRYTASELKQIDDYADMFGIELVPCIQTLAHLGRIFRWKPYGNICDIGDVLLADDDNTYALIEHMFASMSANVRSRKIHIGMDEAHLLGLGAYKDKHGDANRSEIMLRHLNKVVSIAEKFGYKPMMWSDMFFRIFNNGEYYVGKDREIPQEVKDLVPENLSLVYWDYYTTDPEIYDAMLNHHLSFNREVVFAGGAWTWMGFAPCNAFSIKLSNIALDACEKYGIKKVFMTMWGDNGSEGSDLGILPTLNMIAERSYGHKDEQTQKNAFAALTDIPFDKFMAIEAVNVIDENAEPSVNNPSKYMLYNDCIGGLFDYHVKQDDAKIYAKHVKQLKSVEKIAGRYAYIFATQRALAEVLQLKYDLGLLTRNAYKSGDKETLNTLLKTRYRPLIKKLEAFYDTYEKQWSKENKPYGFEIQDYRIGGLIKHIERCAARLEKFIGGELDTIEEFNETMLDPFGDGANAPQKIHWFNWFGGSIGVNGL